MPAATNTGLTDITLQSTEYGDILLAAAYTYNPAGEIGEHNMVEYRIDFSNNSNPDYPTNTSPDGSYIWTHFQRTNDWKELKTIDGTANDSWILAYGFAAGTSGGWNTGAGGYDWIASDAANVLMYSSANYTNYIAITNLPGSSYQVDVVNSFNQNGYPTVAETLHSGLYQLGEEADNGNYGNWPSGGNTNAGLHLVPRDLYNSRTNYVTWTNAVPSNGAISIVLEKTLATANLLNCMRVRGDEGSSGVAPVSGSWTGGYEVVITGINFGNGSDITNVTLCGFVASITGQSSTSVTVTAGAASTGSSGDVVVQSTSYGTTIGSNLFTYVAPTLSVLGTNGAAIASDEAIDLIKGTKFYATQPSVALTNTFAITNTGNDVLSISGWTTNGADAALFTLSGVPASVAVGGVDTFTVVYNPTVVGTHSATINFASDDPGSPFLFNLGGSCFEGSTNVGPYAGGNTLTITNGNFGTITNVLVDGVQATLGANGANWFTITLPVATTTGAVDIVVQTSDNGDTTLHDAYTYNPAGYIPDAVDRLPAWNTLADTWLNGTNGVTFAGDEMWMYSGESVSSAGDVNGDGYADLLIGAPWASGPAGFYWGETYLVYGRSNGMPATVTLTNTWLDGTNGVVFASAQSTNSCGHSVSSAGDVNGDGYADLLISAVNADNDAGKTYLVYGRSNGFPATVTLTNTWLDGTNGITLAGAVDDIYSGESVSSAGDVNGDGYADLLIGAYVANPDGRSDAGETYLVFGRSAGLPATIILTNTWLDGTNGITLAGAVASDYSGYSVSSAGDINGDGYADLLVGAYSADPGGIGSAGETYLIYGRTNGFPATVTLTNSWLDGTNGITLAGAVASDYSGYSVSSAGDINGDGYDDMLIGAYSADPGGIGSAGETYLVYGRSNGLPATITLTNTWLDGTNGITLAGATAGDQCGYSVSSAGDVDRDGYDDLLVSAITADPEGRGGAGETYLVYGRSSGLPATITLDSTWLDATNGVVLAGAVANYNTGYSVSSAGDVNGDRFDDLLVGARRANPDGRTFAGETYLIYGSREFRPMTPDSGSWTGGYPVVIAGDNLGNGGDITNVTLCGIVAPITGQNSTSVTVTAGSSLEWQTGDVVVQSVSYGMTIKSNAFTYLAPSVSVLGTNGATIANGDAIDLTKGSKFYATKPNMVLTNTFAITNAGNDMLSINGWSTNGADADLFTLSGVPTSLAIGAVSNFTVTYAPTTIGDHSAFVLFTNNAIDSPFTLNLAGSCFDVSTNVGPYMGGNTITISNGYFGAITNVLVDGVAATLGANGADWFTITLPAASTVGPVVIVVQTSDNGDTTLNDAYTYNPAGMILTNSPVSGSWTGGYPVVISGSNLCDGGDVTNVTLCGIPVTSIDSQSATQLTVTANTATGALTGDVYVYSVSYGETMQSNAFTYTTPYPTIIGTNGAAITNNAVANSENGTDFGTLIVGMGSLTNTFSITNNGNATMNISAVTTSGVAASAFEIRAWPATVVVGATETFYSGL